jgi:hypothetical protein
MPEQRKFETILTENKLVSGEQLKQIVQYAYAVGIDLHEAILQKKVAPPEAVMMAYAESLGLPFARLADVSIDEEVVARVDPMIARQNSFVPVSIDQGHILVVAAKPVIPEVEAELRSAFNLPVRHVLCMPGELSAALTKYYPRGTAQPATKQRAPKEQEPVEPINEEEAKDRLLKSIIAFNFAFAFVGFGLNYLHIPRGIYNTLYYIPFIMFLGIIGGGIAGVAVWKLLSR